jgi:hypothetical protein
LYRIINAYSRDYIYLVNYQQITNLLLVKRRAMRVKNERKPVILAIAVVNSLDQNPVAAALRLKWKMTLQSFLRLLLKSILKPVRRRDLHSILY